MAKKLPIRAGDVVLFPLAESQAVVGKILYVFEERFDEELPQSEISRETGSNKAGWR